MRQTFKKNERLHGKKQIDGLFEKGNSFFIYPFKVVFLNENSADDTIPKLLVTIPKRHFKRAVDRNKIKRLVREAYRRNKQPLVENCAENQVSVLFGLIYTAKTMLTYSDIERKIILILQRLKEQDGQTAG